MASRLRPLIERIEQRHNVACYRDLLDDCHETYCYWRDQLLASHVSSLVRAALCSSPSLASGLRACFLALIELAIQETHLFHQFFHPSTDVTELFRGAVLGSASASLLAAARPLYIKSRRIDELVALTNLIKIEILEDRVARPLYAHAVAFVAPIASTMLADVQDRLVFLTQAFVASEISGFSPSSADLDYPARLDAALLPPFAAAQGGESQLDAIMASWYPPVRKAIMLLSKLYLTLNATIFEALAQEALRECCDSVARASQLILHAGKADSHVHAQLFYIKHVLILSEQIRPFDIDFQVTERTLDFSPIRTSLNRFLTGDFATLWDTLRNPPAPLVADSSTNTKHDLQQLLAQALHNLLAQHLAPCTAPLLRFHGELLEKSGADQAEALAAHVGTLNDLVAAYEAAVAQQLAPLKATLMSYLDGVTNESLANVITPFQNAILEPVVLIFNTCQSNAVVMAEHGVHSLDEFVNRLLNALIPKQKQSMIDL